LGFAENNHAPPSEFDGFADKYDQALQNGLDLSGEKKDFFAQGRVNILAGLLEKPSLARKYQPWNSIL